MANPEVKVQALLRQHRFRLVRDPRYITSSSPIPVHSEVSNPTPAPGHVRVQVSDPRFVDMMDKVYRSAVCIHESAHAEYMERIGDAYVEFIPLPNDERYKYCPALVTNHRTEEEDLVQMQADPLGYVKSIIAAGIAEQFLTGIDKEEIKAATVFDDKEIEAVFDTLGTSNEERKRILSQARADILKDLRKPAFRHALWARARFFLRILERHLWTARTEAGQHHPDHGGDPARFREITAARDALLSHAAA